MTKQEILDRIQDILYQLDDGSSEGIGALDLLKHELETDIIETDDAFFDSDIKEESVNVN